MNYLKIQSELLFDGEDNNISGLKLDVNKKLFLISNLNN